MSAKQVVTIYTDGSCPFGNPGIGGWGVLLQYGRHEREMYGGELESTNQRSELLAAIAALEALTRPCRVVLYSDSKYVVNGVTAWMPNWKKNGWRTSAKKSVLNRDLWQRLDVAVQPHEVTFTWCKGHAGNEGNERADFLAGQGAQEAATRDGLVQVGL